MSPGREADGGSPQIGLIGITLGQMLRPPALLGASPGWVCEFWVVGRVQLVHIAEGGKAVRKGSNKVDSLCERNVVVGQ